MKCIRQSRSRVYIAVAKATGLKPNNVKDAVEGIMTLAAEQIKKSGSFRLAGMIILKLRRVMNQRAPPCFRWSKPACYHYKVIATKTLKEMVK